MEKIKKDIILIIIIIILLLYFFYSNNKIEFFNKNDNIDNNLYYSLGIYKNNIINNFDLVTKNIKKINNRSYNGFIFKIEYNNPNHIFSNILKSNIGTDQADNIVYEYIVGLFLNKQLLIVPSFIKTHNIYSYKNKENWEIFKNNDELSNYHLENALELFENSDTTVNYCFKYMAILLQYINNSISLINIIKEHSFVNIELYNVLFQIYYTLSTLIDIFTHNDLNCSNILLYKPSKEKYIEYHFYLKNNLIITFKSQYIAKIIDYGNTYFYDNYNNNTEKIYEKICNINNCDIDCYKYSTNSHYKKKITFNYLLNEIVSNIMNNNDEINKESIKLLNIIQNENINTIFENLVEYCDDVKNIKSNNNNFLYQYKKLGDLHIFQDGSPMKFVENN